MNYERETILGLIASGALALAACMLAVALGVGLGVMLWS